MKIKVNIKRGLSDSKQTLGHLIMYKTNAKGVKEVVFTCNTLELAWKDNEKKISCIPTGTYDVVRRDEPGSKFKYPHYLVKGTEPRTYILFHKGNYHSQIEGCILVGLGLADINGDGYLDVTNSGLALDKMLEFAPEGFTLTIE